MVERYTLDTNCVIDIEENRPSAVYIKKMLIAYRKQVIDLAIVAISASENQPGGGINQNYSEFEEKLRAVDFQDLKVLFPMAYWDVAYWDHAIWDGDPELELKIHNVLFAGTPIEKPEEVGFPMRKWQNNKCDVQIAWSHVYYNRDVLVTSDGNFHNHADELSKIGVRKIIRPEQFKP